MKYSKHNAKRPKKYTRKSKSRQKGAGPQSANMIDLKKRILQKYSEVLARKAECNAQCISYMCSKEDGEVCAQTKQFLAEKPAMDSSGFCNNMMAGFPKTCRSSANPSLIASNTECACDRFKRSLYEMDMLKGEMESVKDDSTARIVKELFQFLNIPGSTLSEEAQEFVRLKRQSGSWALNIR